VAKVPGKKRSAGKIFGEKQSAFGLERVIARPAIAAFALECRKNACSSISIGCGSRRKIRRATSIVPATPPRPSSV